jgi:hypothetical protein
LHQTSWKLACSHAASTALHLPKLAADTPLEALYTELAAEAHSPRQRNLPPLLVLLQLFVPQGPQQLLQQGEADTRYCQHQLRQALNGCVFS